MRILVSLFFAVVLFVSASVVRAEAPQVQYMFDGNNYASLADAFEACQTYVQSRGLDNVLKCKSTVVSSEDRLVALWAS